MNDTKQPTAPREVAESAVTGRNGTNPAWATTATATAADGARVLRLRSSRPAESRAAGAASIGVSPAAVVQMPALRSARLVIVEDGANVRELEPPPEGCEHTVVVVQSQGERPSAFAQRVRRRLCSMREEQQVVVWTLFLLAARDDAEAQAARVEIGRLLSRRARALPTSCVLALHAPAGAQCWVLKLFDALILEHSCPGLSAHIRFDQPGQRENVLPIRGMLRPARVSHVSEAKQTAAGAPPVRRELTLPVAPAQRLRSGT